MNQPTHLDLDAARAAAEAVIQNDGGAECYLLEEELLRVFPPKAMIEVFDRLRKAEAARENFRLLLREARATFEMWKDIAPAVSLCADIDKALLAAPDSTPTDSTPTDSADSEGAKG
jgi:hypothetical protein